MGRTPKGLGSMVKHVKGIGQFGEASEELGQQGAAQGDTIKGWGSQRHYGETLFTMMPQS